MTIVEAQKVAAIVSTADGGCSICGDRLAKQLTEHLPVEGFDWEAAVRKYREDQI